jgi:hypothetical protein
VPQASNRRTLPAIRPVWKGCFQTPSPAFHHEKEVRHRGTHM